MPICGIGVDIIEINRFKRIIEKYCDRFVQRVFTEGEIQYCQKKVDMGAPSYSVRFAAKEALFKAIGTGLRHGLTWKDIEISNDKLGKPFFKLYGKTADIIQNRKVMLSLSHSLENSIAFVIIEGEDFSHD
ncbi:holo-ACP synthase [Calditrichota bacterium]